MILWRLHGYADPEGEFEGGEVECAIEHAEYENCQHRHND